MKIINVVGARPNFIKIASLISEFRKYQQIQYLLVHTGQHYDNNMSEMFFNELDIPKPNVNLGVGSGSHAEQTAEIMKRFEKVCSSYNPTHILVVGDVNSTIACALVASKLGIKVIHVEAGLRSFDRSMPEEINRVLTDAISDLLFTTEESANQNLLREGVPDKKIHFVGNVMIDTLVKHREKAKQSDILRKLGLINSQPNDSINPINRYAVLTLHRPSNADNKRTLMQIIQALKEISKCVPVIFPSHPRTIKRIRQFGFGNAFNFVADGQKIESTNLINCTEPLGYLDFLNLMSNSKLVLTDSGGIQEETTILGIPCVTIRNNTERPVTVTHGTNVVSGVRKEDIIKAALSQLAKANKSDRQKITCEPTIPPLWDGKASERIVSILTYES